MSKFRTTARIHLLAAKDRLYCVVLRRKPSRWVHVMLWNTNSNRLEEGSWFNGRIFWEWCDFSPNGEWLFYFAKGHRSYPSWMAICRAPWLKALLHWETVSTYTVGAGIWERSNLMRLGFDWSQPGDWSGDLGPTQSPEVQAERLAHLPFRIERMQEHISTLPGSIRLRMKRDGYQEVQPDVFTRRPSRKHPTLTVSYAGYFNNSGHGFSFALSASGPDLSGVDWACWDAKDRLLVTRDGRLERYNLDSLKKGTPDFSIDLENLEVPEHRQRSRPSTSSAGDVE